MAGFKQQSLGIVLNPPGYVLPMLHGGTGLPVRLAIHQPWLVEFEAPFGNRQLAVPDVEVVACHVANFGLL